MKHTLFLIALLLPFSSFAQVADVAPPKPDDSLRPPALIVKDGDKDKLLALSKADIQVLVDGYVAQTTMTLTFSNDTDRVLEGELSFPLPEGTSVSGYGLDINGQMVDAVAVEKQKARISFETEVRKGIDPGLVEHTVGNNFKTRIYPIPAKGTRTIKVQYEGDLLDKNSALAYALPLNWGKQIKEGNIKIEVLGTEEQPKLEGKSALVSKMAFVKEGNKYTASRSFENVQFIDDLLISLPQLIRPSAVVEQRPNPEDDSKLDHYFLVNDRPFEQIPQRNIQQQQAPTRIGLVWDASLSRSANDKQRELDLLAKILQPLTLDVDLIILRNVSEAPVSFHIDKGDAGKLLEHLKNLAYDGATSLGSLSLTKGRDNSDYSYWLLFSDGLSNMGKEIPQKLDAPVYAISNDAKANHSLLKLIASKSNGQYFNLHRLSNQQVVDGMTSSPFSFISAEYDANQVTEVYPDQSQPLPTGRLALAGKLLSDQATIKLNYGFGNQITKTTTLTLKKESATATGLISRYWAQQKVAQLSIFQDKNHEQLAKIGQSFNLVTPNTSLLVLDNLQQYLTYHITPPRSRGEMYTQYQQQIKQQQEVAKKTDNQKLDHVLALWQEKVKWWEQENKYASDFKYKEPQNNKDDLTNANAGGVLHGTGGGAAGGAPRTPLPGPADQQAQGRADEPQRMAAQVQRLEQAEAAPGNRNNALALLSGASKEAKQNAQEEDTTPTIAIKPWNPDTPYLHALKDAGPDKAYAAYLDQRKTNAASPAFYLDCGDFFLQNKQKELGIRVLSDIAELELDSAPLLRVVAHRLEQVGELDLAIDLFDKVLQMRPKNPRATATWPSPWQTVPTRPKTKHLLARSSPTTTAPSNSCTKSA